jgi:hypothetical protein
MLKNLDQGQCKKKRTFAYLILERKGGGKREFPSLLL